MNTEQLRSQFPALKAEVYGKPLVYLDNAATSQRPQQVIDLWTELSLYSNANIHRAVHSLSSRATDAYEKTRSFVAEWIGAASPREVIFTSGTTASVNLLAQSFGEVFVGEGDEVLVAECEHHSDLVPWQMMCGRRGARLVRIPVTDEGEIDLGSLKSLLNERTRIVCVAHIANVLGIVNPIREIVSICHAKGCPVFCDGAQGIVHEKVDIQELGVDFYAFSGHKTYAATGTGVLYGTLEYLEKMPPFMGGGEMIETVRFEGTTYAGVPARFEAGTQNFNAVPTLVPALELSRRMREEKEIADNAAAVRDYVMDALLHEPGVRLYGTPSDPARKAPVFSFTVDGVHHEDIATLMDKMGVAVRSGQMCAEPLMDRFGVSGMVRASFAPYNTLAEAEFFMDSLRRAVRMLR